MDLVDRIKKGIKNTLLGLGILTYVATCGAPMTAVSLAGMGVYATAVSIPVVATINQIPRDEETAVFVSSYDNSGYVPKWIPKPIVAGVNKFFMYTQVTLRENIEGRNATWFTDLKKNEVLGTIANTEYQSFVFIGHGGKGSFCSHDGCVSSYAVKKRRFPKRSGEIVQYTCGDDNGRKTLADALLENPNNIIDFDKVVWPHHIYKRSWQELGRSMFGD